MSEALDRAYEAFAIGDHVWFRRAFDAASFDAFADLSGDRSPLHHDKAYAAQTSFGSPIVPMHLAAAPFSAVVGMMLPGVRALYLSHEMRARLPVPFDTDVTYSARIVAKQDARQALDLSAILFHGDEVLLEGRLLVQVRGEGRIDGKTEVESDATIHSVGRRRALVTGARGAIGRATALALARSGWDLALQYRTHGTDDALADACRALGADVSCHECDLANAEEVAVLTKVLARETPLTDVIHCASPAIDAGIDALVNVNHSALVAFGRGLIPEMLKAQDGRFLFVGSSALQHNPRGWEDYIAAKAAATHWTEGLNARYGKWGLSGHVVAPGYVETHFSDGYRQPGSPVLMPEQVAEAIVGVLRQSDRRGDSYLWLEPNGQRSGRYGFQDHTVTAMPSSIGRQQLRGTSEPQSKAAVEGESVDSLVAEFFGLASSIDLTNAGVDRLKGWDSLRHIELMLFLEQRLGLQFHASEIERTTDLDRLTELVAEKQSQPRSMRPA